MYPRHTKFSNQRGAALMMALVFMLLLTMLGVGAMQSSSLQERMAGNVRDSNLAFQAAEAAARSGEDVLQGATLGTFNGTNGLYLFCSAGMAGTGCGAPDWSDRGSTGWKARPNTTGAITGVRRAPEFIIEQLPPIDDPTGSLASDEPGQSMELYRVTARGFGQTDASMSVIQVMYRRN